MPAAELIAIGTELLLGEIQDTNTRYLARSLRDIGVDVYRATIVGDNTERIAQAIREAMQRCQIIITSGGLGPTVDDPTRAAVAQAVGVDIEFRPELWEQIQARFSRYGRIPSDNNRRQAWIPTGAIPVENPVGTAPSFIYETINSCIISLPGVPRELEHLMQHAVTPYLRERFQLTGTIKARVLHVAGVGESTIDDWIGDLETESNPSVGLLAHPGQVDIRITAKAETMAEADQMIARMEEKVRARVSEGLYGVDQETLEGAVLQALRDRGWQAALVECGVKGALRERMEKVRFPAANIFVHEGPVGAEELRGLVKDAAGACGAEAGVGCSLHPEGERSVLHIYAFTPGGEEAAVRSHGGERALSFPWSVNTSLELLRRKILNL